MKQEEEDDESVNAKDESDDPLFDGRFSLFPPHPIFFFFFFLFFFSVHPELLNVTKRRAAIKGETCWRSGGGAGAGAVTRRPFKSALLHSGCGCSVRGESVGPETDVTSIQSHSHLRCEKGRSGLFVRWLIAALFHPLAPLPIAKWERSTRRRGERDFEAQLSPASKRHRSCK